MRQSLLQVAGIEGKCSPARAVAEAAAGGALPSRPNESHALFTQTHLDHHHNNDANCSPQ
jgi:hypothetical protein